MSKINKLIETIKNNIRFNNFVDTLKKTQSKNYYCF